MSLITSWEGQAGALAPDQRDVGLHMHTIGSKPTAHSGPPVPSTPNYEDHNLAFPPDPDRDPEVGITIIGEAGTEVPAVTDEEEGSGDASAGPPRRTQRRGPRLPFYFRLGEG